MLEFRVVSIGSGGAPLCAKCRAATPVSPRPLSEFVAEVDALASLAEPPQGIVLAGMEPFAHPELPALISTVAQAGFDRIRIRTDGGALASHGNAGGIISAGVTQVEVRLSAGDARSHDALTQRPGLFDAAVAGARAFHDAAADAGVRVALTGRVRACPHTEPHLPSVVAAFARMGACAVVIESAATTPLEVLLSACDTATVNGVAACVIGDDRLPEALAVCPWRETGLV